MLKHLLLTIGIVLSTSLALYSQSGALQGKVLDKDTKEPIPFANVAVFSGGSLLTGSTSDFDGKYVIKPLSPGKYAVRASFVGYQTKEISGVVVSGNQITFQDLELTMTAETLETVEVVEYKVPLISKDKTTSGATVTSEEIEKMPNRSANSIATTVGGVYSNADGGDISIRGQRQDGTAYYIDGMRVIGSGSLPESSIDQVQVILGGVPASYGDATGGIISVTTKGPSREFGAGMELQTSKFLDNYGYYRVGFNLQGPLLTKNENGTKTSLLGYFLAGDISYDEDGYAATKGTLSKVTDDYLAFLKENPQRVIGNSGLENTSLFTRKTDTEVVKQSQNTANTDVSLSGKLDLRVSSTVNFTMGGSFNYRDYKAFDLAGSLFNYENNAHVNNSTWRVFGKLTQRFATDKESNSLVKNVFYSLQADYSKFDQTVEDDSHRDKLFNYGYLGKFETYKRRSYVFGLDTVSGLIAWKQDDWQDTAFVFNGWNGTEFTSTAFDVNPEVARYTEQYYELNPWKGNIDIPGSSGYWRNYEDVRGGNGLLNGESPEDVYTLWNNVGEQYDGYNVTDNSQFSFSANASADIGNHAIEFGLQYEQRTNRAYGYGPVGLWGLMRQMTNFHIQNLDFNNPLPIYVTDDYSGAVVFQDTINYNNLYSETDQRIFDMNLRQKMGLPLDGTDWIDVDSYDLNTQTINYYDESGVLHKNVAVNGGLSIDMFSPDELLNSGNSYVFYYGYDPYGNKQTTRPSFDDFFEPDENPDALGRDYYQRKIGAFEPIYMAGYIQDKFAFDDLIFNIGLRVDRFDANQMVLKDPYLFYDAYTASEVNLLDGKPVTHPANIDPDAVVYVNLKDNPTKILGYREENVWYNSSGTVIQDPDLISGAEGITPYLVHTDSVMSSNSFKDYDPQISVMPRISFSFPISDEALFFAHYDILTQRPTSFLRMNPIQYYYIQSIDGSISNPNLKPEKSIDYELGFQQKISNTSSLKISAFYREIRDQIAYYRFNGAYTGGGIDYYDSYNNLDFATVKGLTVEYDLRRTSNVRARISYTLQFAEGTGSSPGTSAALVNANLPNLRTIFPLDWDRRHAFNIVLDYRFGAGADYNGPTSTRTIKGTDQVKTTQWLKNLGANLTISGGSGTPYTKSNKIIGVYAGGGGYELDGTINGSRLPWQFRMDARIDKDIELTKNPKSNTYLNVYLQVLNILDAKNIITVYPATGSANDDGYLTAPEWQSNINSASDPAAYRDLYALRMNSPFNYSTPRRIRLGIVFNF